MAEQLSDDALSAALAGDPSGFSAVYTVNSPAVLGYFRARGVEDPEALTQDVFVDVLPKLANVTGGHAGLRTFIFSVAHARLVDYRRRAERTPYLAEYDPLVDARYSASAEDEALGSLAASLAPSPRSTRSSGRSWSCASSQTFPSNRWPASWTRHPGPSNSFSDAGSAPCANS